MGLPGAQGQAGDDSRGAGIDGTVSLDFGGKGSRRGAYICPNPECLKKALRSKALDRSLEVTIPEEVYQRLEKEMEHGSQST